MRALPTHNTTRLTLDADGDVRWLMILITANRTTCATRGVMCELECARDSTACGLVSLASVLCSPLVCAGLGGYHPKTRRLETPVVRAVLLYTNRSFRALWRLCLVGVEC